MNLTNDDWHRLLISATRQALPSKSHTSREMAEIMAKNAEYIEANTREILIRDISSEIARGTIRGLDLPAWEQTLNKLKEQDNAVRKPN